MKYTLGIRMDDGHTHRIEVAAPRPRVALTHDARTVHLATDKALAHSRRPAHSARSSTRRG